MDEVANPYEPVFCRTKPRAKGSLSALQTKAWTVLLANMIRLEQGMLSQNSEEIHKASQVIIQVGHLLAKLMVSTELSQKLDHLLGRGSNGTVPHEYIYELED